MKSLSRLGAIVALGCCLAAVPVRADIQSGAIGNIDDPAEGAQFNRPMGAPHALVDFQASGMEVWITGAAAFQLFNVQVSFYLELDGGILDADLPPPFLAQADANGYWIRRAKETGILQQLQRGVGPGNHAASIESDLVVNAGGAPNANYEHAHSFTVN